MNRAAMYSTTMVGAMVGVSGCHRPEFTSARVGIDYARSEVIVYITGAEEPPCPGVEEGAMFAANGDRFPFDVLAGEASDPGIDHGYCDALESYGRPVDLSGGQLIIEIESRRWPMRFEGSVSPVFEIWSDDDLNTAVSRGEPFEVQWSPVEARRAGPS